MSLGLGDSISKDSMNTGEQTSETQFHGSYNNPLATFLDKECGNGRSLMVGSQKSKRNMPHSISLFRKYLLDKVHQGKDIPSEEEAIKLQRYSRGQFPPQSISSTLRHPSFLEQEILPGTRNQESKAQLTIFYSGAINVYDNVPIDKAQAILLLAGQSSSANTISPKMANASTTPTTLSHSTSSPSVCKLEADLPIARKISLQRFFERRRNRILNKAPYPPTTIKRDVHEAAVNECLVANPASSPSSFPSSFGSFVPFVSANMT